MEKKSFRRRPIFHSSGKRGELMRILLTCGGISYNGLHMLDGKHRLYSETLKKMQEEGLTNMVRVGNKKVSRFDNFDLNYEKFITLFPLGYYGYYNRYAKINSQRVSLSKSDFVKSERAFREIEILMMMYGSGVNCFMEDKPSFRTSDKLEDDACYYYSAHELKDKQFTLTKRALGSKDTEKDFFKSTKSKEEFYTTTINSRAIGTLIFGDENYIVYHSGNNLLKWLSVSEYQYSSFSADRIREKNPKLVGLSIENMILVAYKQALFKKIIFPEREKYSHNFNVRNGYERIFALTYDRFGKEMLKFMKRKNWKQEIIDYMLPEVPLSPAGLSVDCDGFDGSTYYLSFGVPEVKKLKRFISVQDWIGNDMKFEVHCFDEQLPIFEGFEIERNKIISHSFTEFLSVISRKENSNETK